MDMFRIETCSDCKLMRLNPQPADELLRAIDNSRHVTLSEDFETQHLLSQLKTSTAEDYLNLIESYAGHPLTGELLEIGCGHGDFLIQAERRGLTVTGIEYSAHAAGIAAARLRGKGQVIVGEISCIGNANKRYDIIVFADVLEHIRNPRSFLQSVHALLKEDGLAVIALPSVDSLSARLMGTRWPEFKPEHLWYFSTRNLMRLLYSESFGALKSFPAKKTLCFDRIAGHFARCPAQPYSWMVKLLGYLLPKMFRRYPIKLTTSGILVLARRTEYHVPKKLSVVMPAYNEVRTIAAAMERVLTKEITGIETELVVVESNSNDGTRDIVRSFQYHDRVKIVLQDRPRGKGNAVRAGFAVASGDYILVQDADDEYDIEDYDALLEPLISGEESFVLGARHGGGLWKMRQFGGQPLISHALNFGHWLFATLLNLTYGLRLKDPFTMYKVFRTDCLRTLTFECDRFDFDYELVIKLARSGYIPLEIPVNYRSRSFKEGKKVDVLRDPLTWLKAIVKFRIKPI
jgi:2-polyprenyl-3-methyl-5-hydroxy-6-metoxy-1,4-benzoquinol methylase